jgi:hypothetical protein
MGWYRKEASAMSSTGGDAKDEDTEQEEVAEAQARANPELTAQADTFQAALRKFREAAVKRFDTDKAELPTPAFHYTSMENLGNVLRSGSIWATDGHFLNDSTELRLAARIARDVIRETWSPRAPVLADAVVHAIDEDWLGDRHQTFIASFSSQRDSLSQWRAYANNGAGVAIGIDLSELLEAKGSRAELVTAPVVARCEYHPQRQRELLLEALSPQLELATGSMTRGLNPSGVARVTAKSVLTSLITMGCVLKNPGFEEEAEWRVLVMSSTDKVPRLLDFRPTHVGMAAYIPIPLAPGGGPPPIRHVVLGPRTERIAKRSIRLMLDRYGCAEAAITHSEVSYR